MRAGPAGEGVIPFALDQSDQPLAQIERRDQQFFHSRITGQAGERVENDRDFFGDFWIRREQTEIGVDARGARMIIAGAQMHVMAQTIGIAPHDEERFAVRL